MGIGAGILLYQMIWMILFFMVLPWRSKRSTPEDLFKPKIFFKIGITTLLASLGWGIAYTVITLSPFSFRQEKAPWMLPVKISSPSSP